VIPVRMPQTRTPQGAGESRWDSSVRAYPLVGHPPIDRRPFSPGRRLLTTVPRAGFGSSILSNTLSQNFNFTDI
jgi:hypothetical protein